MKSKGRPALTQNDKEISNSQEMYKNEGGCPGRNESLSVDGSKQPEAGVARQALKGIVYLADT